MSGSIHVDIVLNIWTVQGTGYSGGVNKGSQHNIDKVLDLPHHAL